MKKQIEKLKELVNYKYEDQEKRTEIAVYLSVCFLGLDGENVARYFGMKYHKARHYITKCGVELKKSQFFMDKMHQIAKEYNSQLTLKLSAQ